MIEAYIMKRETLSCLFILIDSRHEPQKIDLSFIRWAGEKGVPICLVFTKTDKNSRHELQKNLSHFQRTMKESWEELPPIILTSAIDKSGREEVLALIEKALSAQT